MNARRARGCRPAPFELSSIFEYLLVGKGPSEAFVRSKMRTSSLLLHQSPPFIIVCHRSWLMVDNFLVKKRDIPTIVYEVLGLVAIFSVDFG